MTTIGPVISTVVHVCVVHDVSDAWPGKLYWNNTTPV